MTKALLLDTHIAVWLDAGDARLKPSTLALIEDCWHRRGIVYLSPISAWEVAMLVDLGRLRFDMPVDDWAALFTNRPGIQSAPLTMRAAARSYRLQPFDRRDPGDRLLIATAIDLGCPLVTYDDHITQFAQRWGGQYGFSVAA